MSNHWRSRCGQLERLGRRRACQRLASLWCSDLPVPVSESVYLAEMSMISEGSPSPARDSVTLGLEERTVTMVNTDYPGLTALVTVLCVFTIVPVLSLPCPEVREGVTVPSESRRPHHDDRNKGCLQVVQVGNGILACLLRIVKMEAVSSSNPTGGVWILGRALLIKNFNPTVSQTCTRQGISSKILLNFARLYPKTF